MGVVKALIMGPNHSKHHDQEEPFGKYVETALAATGASLPARCISLVIAHDIRLDQRTECLHTDELAM